MIDCWLLVDGNDNVAIDDKAGAECWRIGRFQIPSVGFATYLVSANEFVQRGWRGELLFGDKQYRSVTASATELNARR
jgi:hypothetical protein